MQMRGGGRPAAAVEAVIFDWGGVISRRPSGATRRALERRLGLEPGRLGDFFGGDDWLLHSTGLQGEAEFWERVCAGFPVAPDRELAATTWRHIFVEPPVRSGLVAILRELRGRVRVGLLSNAGTSLRKIASPLLGSFDDVVISAEVGCHKPDREIFDLALSRLGTEPNATLFVDDLSHNVAAARELGIRAHRFWTPGRLRRWLVAQGVLAGITPEPPRSAELLNPPKTVPGDTVLFGSMRGIQGGER